MIELDRGTLLSEPFRQAYAKVAVCSKLEPKVAYRVMRTTKLVEKELTDAKKAWIELLRKYVPVNSDNNFVLDESGQEFKWSEGVDPEVAKVEIKTLREQKVTIDRDRFELEQLAPAGLSPSDLAWLDPFINQPE